MNTNERRWLIETLVHDYEHDLMEQPATDSEKYAELTTYRHSLYNLGAADLLETYENWYSSKYETN